MKEIRIIWSIIIKEYTQIFRNRVMLPFIFVLPVVQLLILANAATLEMKSIQMVVVDLDHSSESKAILNKFRYSPFFQIVDHVTTHDISDDYLKKGTADVVLIIPHDFEKHILRGEKSAVKLNVDAINGMAAQLTQLYSSEIISRYARSRSSASKEFSPNITWSFWYNPTLNFTIYMVPGILVILVTIIGMFLSSLNLVREKENGTIEQINVTPVKKYQFLIGKLIPFWSVALIELCIGMVVGWYFFKVPVEGSIILLLFYASIYLVAVMGIGLLMSAISSNQQQVMFLSFFFMLVFVLMSGIFTPVESMPGWAKTLNYLNPLAGFMRVIRMILLKGSYWHDIVFELIHITVFAIVSFVMAVWRYKKTV